MNFSVVLMNKNCVQKCNSSPKIGVGQCEFRYNIVNFDKERSVPKEIPSEVEVSVVKMFVITRGDSTFEDAVKEDNQIERDFTGLSLCFRPVTQKRF